MGVVPAAIVIPPANSVSHPCNRANASRAPTPLQGDSHKLRLGRWTIAGACLVSGSQSPIDENLRAGLGTHVHTHAHRPTHASGYTFRRLSPEYGNFAIYLINFCLFHIKRRMWKINGSSYGSKRYKSRAQLFHMPHTLPLPRDCNLAKIMLANKNGKRHKRVVPQSLPLSLSLSRPLSISLSLCLCLYISVYKCISASCTCGTL